MAYEITKSKNGGLWLSLQPAEIADQMRFAKENGVTNFSCTFHQTDKVETFPSFDGIEVTGLFIGSLGGIKNNQSLNGLSHLQVLKMNFEGPVSLLDLSRLTLIEELEITYNNKVKGLSSLVNLKDLRLLKYKPSSMDLVEFEAYQKVRKIRLAQPALKSLDGIQYLDQLLELQVYKPRGLTAFFTKDPQKSLQGLKQLELTGCKELNFSTIPVMESLNELRILDCGNNISDLHFVSKNFPNLKTLTFVGSASKDGNLNCLAEHPALERVTIDHKTHYNLKEKEINTVLAGKRRGG